MNKILINTFIAVLVSFGIAKASFAASYNQIDNTFYPVKTEGFWAVEEVNDGSSYKFKNFECVLKSNYIGKSGTEVKVTSPQMNGEYQIVKINTGEYSKINQTPFSSWKAPFKQPTLQFINLGCSKYLDGDTCKNDLNDRPMVSVACRYTQ